MKAILSLVLVVVSLVACHTNKNNTPAAITKTSINIPWVKDIVDPAQANAIGDAIEKNLLATHSLFQQNEVVNYIQEIGANIAMFSARPHHPTYKFYILDTQAWINIGLPGGHVFISRGVLKQIKTEAELAGLLGSNIAHITHQHLLNWLQKDKNLDLSTTVNPEDSIWTEALEKLKVQGFGSPDMDKADQSGMAYAMHAGYDPAGLQQILQRLVLLLEQDASLQTQGMLGYNALSHRSSIGQIHLEQVRIHEKVFSKRKGHFHNIEKYL